MKMKIVSIRDRAVDSYMRPWFVQALGQAQRLFQDEIQRVDPENPLAKHPEDYDLYELGEFDDQTGQLVSLERPRQIAIGKEQVKP